MLVDEIDINVSAGHGGAGKISFVASRSQKGGPDGGNGGRGGDVYIRVVSDLTVLSRYTNHKTVEAENGGMGGKQKKSGVAGKDIEIILSVGTTLTDLDTGEQIELLKTDERILIAKGGLGGKGNFEFRSSIRTTPKFAQNGLAGEKRNFQAVLKLIAQFGLIGLPNAGKSSLLNELTSANVKTAEYPFTTIEPNLGMLDSFIIADIPGLLEGASEGKGLGIKFLKHIEKVKVLLHCITSESDNPLNDYKVVRKEMEKFNPELLKKEEIILLAKTDLVKNKVVLEKVKILKKLKRKILPVSVHDFDSIENLKKVLTGV